MRTWMADVAGLLIGFAIGGAALVHFLPELQGLGAPAPAAPVATPVPVSKPPPVRPTPPAPPAPEPAITTVLRPDPAPLPSISYPGAQSGEHGPPPAAGTVMAGTGFFVAYDGLLLTAAHVARDCRKTEVLSPYVAPAPATILARDPRQDIALLRARVREVPATLAIGRPGAGRERVFVLGYPTSAELRTPEETWGVLENAHLPREAGPITDARNMVWLEAHAIRHGYSGGPILEPDAGVVVGIVRATVDGQRLRGIPGMPTSGVAIGPGSGALTTFLQHEAPGTDAYAANRWGNDPLDVARRATVHVLCWH